MQIPGGPQRMGDMPEQGKPWTGPFSFRVEKAEIKTSKRNKSNKYINVQLKVTEPEENLGRTVFDILMLGEEWRWKLRAFLTSCGQSEDFELTDTDELVEMEGKAVAVIEKKRTMVVPGQGEVTYPAKTKVGRYLNPDGSEMAEPEETEEGVGDEDIPY